MGEKEGEGRIVGKEGKEKGRIRRLILPLVWLNWMKRAVLVSSEFTKEGVNRNYCMFNLIITLVCV